MSIIERNKLPLSLGVLLLGILVAGYGPNVTGEKWLIAPGAFMIGAGIIGLVECAAQTSVGTSRGASRQQYA